MKIKGIIFDMDGLMLDTEKLLMKFWIKAAEFYGYAMKPEHVLSIRSLAGKYAEPKLKSMFGDNFNYNLVRLKRIEMMNEYIDKYGVEKKKGLDKLLNYLKSNDYKIAVATATDEIRTERYLKNASIWGCFDKIICGPMVENGKPEPDIYIKAAKELNLKEGECLALEDSPNGILSAYRAGCIPVMIPDLSPIDKETQKLVYAAVENLEAVIKILESII